MNISMQKDCYVRELKRGDFFMRGRWLYKLIEKRGKRCKAARCDILSSRKLEVLTPRVMDVDSEVTLVKLPPECRLVV